MMNPNSKTKVLFRVIIFMLSVSIFWACYPEEEIISNLDKEKDDFAPKNGDHPLDEVIFEFYTQYQSRILYDFTREFYNRRFLEPRNYTNRIVLQTNKDILLEGVKHLKKHFIAYYPESFGKEYFPPYFLLADTIVRFHDKDSYAHAKTNTSLLALGRVRTGIENMSEADLKKSKDDLHIAFWSDYMGKANKLNINPAFHNVSGYSKESNLTEISNCKSSDPIDIKKYGFWADSKENKHPKCSPLSTRQIYPPNQEDDISQFVENILSTNETNMNAILEKYPLLKQKYDILIPYFKEYYKVDLESIRNGTPEFGDE